MITSKREELAWAAGFFDGEGCIGCYITSNGSRRYKAPRIMIQIAQIHPEVLVRFKNAVGLGRIKGPYPQRNENSVEYWKFDQEGFVGGQAIIAQLWPFLSTVKKDDAIKAFKQYYDYVNRKECTLCGGTNMKRDKRNHVYCGECRSKKADKAWATKRTAGIEA